MKASRLASLLFAALLGWLPAAQAQLDPVNDDTDIFLANPSIPGAAPNVLFMIDSTSNWNSYFDMEMSAIKAVLDDAAIDTRFNIGMALFSQSGSGTLGGAFIKKAIKNMTTLNKDELIGLVDPASPTAIVRISDAGSGIEYSAASDEIYNYFAGLAVRSGVNQPKRDPSALANPGAAIGAANTYVSPITEGCQKNFVIWISNGAGQDNSSLRKDVEGYLGGITSQVPPYAIAIPTPNNASQVMWSDEYARWMANNDCNVAVGGEQTVYTYTIDIDPGKVNTALEHTKFLRSMASHGKGRYFSVTNTADNVQLVNHLKTIFAEVQAVNSVFASVALPVSVNVRGTNLNQVYIGVFRPDAQKSPRWLGNLKMYKIALDPDTGEVFLTDASIPSPGEPPFRAENIATGFISPTAKSFWTETQDFWGFRTGPENGAAGANDLPDGDIVEKGGAAQQIRLLHSTDQTNRRLFTCLGASGALCSAGPLQAFDDANTDIEAPTLGAYDTFPVQQIEVGIDGVTATVTMTTTGPLPDAWATAAASWIDGNGIRIEGAPIGAYNVTNRPIDDLNVAARTFTYQLETPVPADTARASHGTINHGLVNGDLVTVSGADKPAFNITADVHRVDDKVFRYDASGVAGAATGFTILGKKQVTKIVADVNALTATMTLPAHGYGATSSTHTVSVEGTTVPEFLRSGVTATVIDANTLVYPILSAPSVGSADTAVATTSTNHGFATNQIVTVKNAPAGPPTYNGTYTASVVSATKFSFPIDPTLTFVADASGTTLAGIQIAEISHPLTGSPPSTRDVMTIRTTGPHGLSAGGFTISGTGGTPPGSSGALGYDGSYTITQVINETTFTASGTDVRNVTTSPLTSATNPGMLLNQRVVSGIVSNISDSTCFTFHPVTCALPHTIRSVKQVWTGASPAPILSAVNFTTGNITAGRPQDASETARTALITWIRGRDTLDENTAVAAPNVRPSVHGDVLHSRPAVVNYNRERNSENDITVFYGSNDGVFRAVKAGNALVVDDEYAAPLSGSVESGQERWGFLPLEFHGKYKRQRDQFPAISGSTPRDYFVDGAISVYSKDADNDGRFCATRNFADCPVDTIPPATEPIGDKVNLYLSMRRGGSFLYALDVIDPMNPKFLWRKRAGDPGYEELGQTWSEPKVTRVNVNLYTDGPTDPNPDNVVLIFGGGYHPEVEDINPCLLTEVTSTSVTRYADPKPVYTSGGSCTVNAALGTSAAIPRDRGRTIIVADAMTGDVLWAVGPVKSPPPTVPAKYLGVPDMSYAIAADVRLLDLDGNGTTDALYVGDTGGQVWRVDLASNNFDKWAVRKIASLFTGDPTVISGKRKFAFAPDVTLGEDSQGLFFGVLIGSGDREHPFETNVANRFYMIKDRGATTTGSFSGNNQWSIEASGGTEFSRVVADADLAEASVTPAQNLSGWKYSLALGEKTVSGALTVGGTTFFSTNQPGSVAGLAACASNLGVARVYQVSFADAGPVTNDEGVLLDRSVVRAGGGYIPSPVFAAIGLSSGSATPPPTDPMGSSTGTCTGAACASDPGGPDSGGVTPTGIVCFGPFCFSTGKVDVGSRRRAYWYKEID